MQPAFRIALFVLVAVAAGPAVAPAQPLRTPEGGAAEARTPSLPGATVTGEVLPLNRRFPDLDAYLAHLRSQSKLDRAWYKEIRPGVFELQMGNFRPTDGKPQQRIFTREELERKFGFAR